MGNDIHLVLHAMALHKLAHLHTMALMFEQCTYQTLEWIASRAEVGNGRFELIARSRSRGLLLQNGEGHLVDLLGGDALKEMSVHFGHHLADGPTVGSAPFQRMDEFAFFKWHHLARCLGDADCFFG